MSATKYTGFILPVFAFVLVLGAAPVSGPIFGASTAMADDSAPPPSVRTQSSLAKARKQIERLDFGGALVSLEAAKRQTPRSADVYNLLGFANRKLGRLDVAMVNYKKALGLDRNHRGANEYIGELYLQKGDLPSAKKHLAVLDRVCTFGCEEYYDLKKAVQAFAASKHRPSGPAPAPAASAPGGSGLVGGRSTKCADVGGYEAYMKATGKTCTL